MKNLEVEVKEFLKARVKSLYGRNVYFLKNEQELVRDLGLDSLDIIECWIDLEEIYQINIDDKDAKDLKTIGDVITLLGKYVK